MSDYLSRLVNRSFHPEIALQPRPVSRFEQTGLNIAPVQAESYPEIDEEKVTISPVARPSRPSISPRQELPSPEPMPIPRQPAPAPSLTMPVQPNRSFSPSEDLPAQPYRGRLDIPVPPEIVQTHTVHEQVIERTMVPVQETSKGLPQKTSVPLIPPPRAEMIPHETPPVPKTVQSPPQTMITPALHRVLPDLSSVSAPKAAQTSEQTINVTIGRVEVRATSPSAAPPRAASKQTVVMGLDEYLRRKTGGGQ